MGINITHTMDSFQFENRENLRNTAKNLLSNKGASKETVQKIVDKTIFDVKYRDSYQNPQLAIIKASTQMSVNNSLKETLKYLKNHAAKRQAKTPVLGELWNIATKSLEEKPYNGELCDFEVDSSLKNIFAA